MSKINENTMNDNISSNLDSLEGNSNFNYDDNVKKLGEIAKIVFPNIQQYSLKRQKQIFFTYAPYNMMDPIAYSLIEKNLIKSFNTTDLIEIIKFLKCLSLSKKLPVSQSSFLLIEQKIIKNLASLTTDQFLSVLESYNVLTLKKNNKIYRTLLGFYSNKFTTMPLLKSLKAVIFLIRSKQCNIKIMIGVLERVYNNTIMNLESLNLQHLTLVYFLFFSEFLQKNLLDKQTIENNYKFQIKENINQILLTGIALKNDEDINETANSFLLNPKVNYAKIQKKFEEKMEKLLISEKNKLNLNDLFIFLESFIYLGRKFPPKFEESFENYINENILRLTPIETFKLMEIAHDKNLKSEKNVKEFLIKSFTHYVEKYSNDFSSEELINIWKIIDCYSLSNFF